VFLMEKFHEFYVELLDVHAQLDADKIPALVVHERLASLLNRQESEAQRETGHVGLETFRRAKYAMAALADEILLRHDAHHERWMTQLLEADLFRSQRAGEKLFDDIENIRELGSSAGELARVYLAVLALGFQGVYSRRPHPDEEIKPYREKLFGVAYGRGPLALTDRGHVAAAAYESTLTDGESGQLPHLKPWIYAMVLLVILYVAAGAAIWQSTVSGSDNLEDILRQINQVDRTRMTTTTEPCVPAGGKRP
jgi:type VI secretion system protein ImpK